MLEVGIAQLVSAAPGVQALIGSPARFYPVRLPDSPLFPCASYQLISAVPEYLLDGSQSIEIRRLQIDTWSGGETKASYLDAKNVQAAIRAILEGYSGELPDGTRIAAIFVANATDIFEQDALAYRAMTEYMVHFYPAP